jgi:hypothetical protein
MRCFVLALSIISVRAQTCAKEEAEVKDLKKKLASCQSDVGTVISVFGVLSHTSTIAGDTVKHYLDQTDIDDKVYDAIAGHFGSAKAMSVDMMGKVASIDYQDHWKTLTQHDVYKTHVAPALDAVHKTAQPYVKEYVNPALEKAHGAQKHVNDNMLPELQRQTTMVYDQVNPSALTSKVSRIIDPVYVFAGRASPKLAKVLPSDVWDRILLLIIAVISFYYFLITTYFLTRKAFWVTKTTTSLAIQLCIVLPLWLLWQVFRIVLFFATCGFCCGLCSRKKNIPKNGAEKKHKNGNDKEAAPKKATAEEIDTLLQGSKKGGKLDSAVNVFVGFAKNGKPLTGKAFPENMKGKLLDVATLKKALSKYKEVDQKKLGL